MGSASVNSTDPKEDAFDNLPHISGPIKLCSDPLRLNSLRPLDLYAGKD
jgi:hypothetical protein